MPKAELESSATILCSVVHVDERRLFTNSHKYTLRFWHALGIMGTLCPHFIPLYMPAAHLPNKIPLKIKSKTMFKHQNPKLPQPIVHLNAGKTKRHFSIRNNVQEAAQWFKKKKKKTVAMQCDVQFAQYHFCVSRKE